MDFSAALTLAKQGKHASRTDWPSGNYLFVQKAYPEGIAINKNTAEATGQAEGTLCRFMPYLQVWDAKTQAFHMYTPSNQDIMSDDWFTL